MRDSDGEFEVLMVLDSLLARRPAWTAQAACRGQGIRFHALEHEEAVARFCSRCPVTEECLVDLFQRVQTYGQREMNDGDTVCGGLVPAEQRVAYKAWRLQQGDR